MIVRGKATLKRLIDLLHRSDADLKLAADAAASLNLSIHLLERITRARQEAAHARRAVEAVKERARGGEGKRQHNPSSLRG